MAYTGDTESLKILANSFEAGYLMVRKPHSVTRRVFNLKEGISTLPLVIVNTRY
jgi:hypothetical protein